MRCPFRFNSQTARPFPFASNWNRIHSAVFQKLPTNGWFCTTAAVIPTRMIGTVVLLKDDAINRASMICLALLASGCATTQIPHDQPVLALNTNDTPTSRPDIFLTGSLRGTLKTAGRCIVVIGSGTTTTPLWPVGTQIRRDNGNTVVALPDGRGAVRLGKTVTLAGGIASRDAALIPAEISADCPDAYFSVGTAR